MLEINLHPDAHGPSDTSPDPTPSEQVREAAMARSRGENVLLNAANVYEKTAAWLRKYVDEGRGRPELLMDLTESMERLSLILRVEVQRAEGVNLTTMPMSYLPDDG